MHVYNYQRLSFPGYPVRDEQIQKLYKGDCSSNPQQLDSAHLDTTSRKCKNLK